MVRLQVFRDSQKGLHLYVSRVLGFVLELVHDSPDNWVGVFEVDQWKCKNLRISFRLLLLFERFVQFHRSLMQKKLMPANTKWLVLL